MTSHRKVERLLAKQARRKNPRGRSVRRASARLAGVAYSPMYEPSSPTARAIEAYKSRRRKPRRKKAEA